MLKVLGARKIIDVGWLMSHFCAVKRYQNSNYSLFTCSHINTHFFLGCLAYLEALKRNVKYEGDPGHSAVAGQVNTNTYLTILEVTAWTITSSL